MRNKRSNKISISGQHGFTLIEIMVAMAISGMVMAAIYMSFRSQIHNSTAQGQITEMQQNIRAALHVMVSEIRMAGYDPAFDSGTAGITTATANNLVFTLVADDDELDNDNADGDNDSSTGADEPGELMTIAYDLYDAYGDGDNDIGRQVGAAASTKRALAENIEAIEFYYTLEDGTLTLTPTVAQYPNIRTVQISIIARSAYPAKKFTDTTIYTTASGAAWGPPYDGVDDNKFYRRRLLTTRVQCRNMGL